MKRFLIGVLILAFVVAIPLSTTLMAKKGDKVEICHLNSSNDAVFLLDGREVNYGRVIKVSAKAVQANVSRGDSTVIQILTEARRTEIEEEYGVNLTNANCWFVVK